MEYTKRKLRKGRKITQNDETFVLVERQPSPWRGEDMPRLDEIDGLYRASQRWLVDINGFRTHRYVSYVFKRGQDVSASCAAWYDVNDNEK